MMKIDLVKKTIKDWKIWTIVLSAIIVIGVTLAAILGFNTSIDLKSAKIVSVDYSAVYVSEPSIVADACEASFKESGVKPVKTVLATDVTDGEIIYYFDQNTDVAAAVAELKKDVATATGSDLVKVNTWTEDFVKGVAEGFIVRAAIATAVFAVLAFVYVSLRYKLSMGITMAAALVATAGATVGFIGGARIPVAPSFAYAVIFACFVTAVLVLLAFNRMRDNAKDKEKQKDMSIEAKVLEAVDLTQALVFVAALAIAVVLLGAFVFDAIWFAVTALIGLIVAAFVAVIFVPSFFVMIDKEIKRDERKPLFKARKKEVAKVKETPVEVAEDTQAE